MGPNIIEAGAICTVAGTIAYVVKTLIVNVRRQMAARLQADVMTKLIDKIGSSPELGRWLESGGAKQFFDFEVAEKDNNPRSRILNSIQMGFIALAIGIAILSMSRSRYEEVYILGGVLSAVGAAFLVSSGVSYYLSSQWGILKNKEPER